MSYIITDPCQTCQDGACLTFCPADCIRRGPDQYYIDPDECIDCGACLPVCPVDAIFHEDELDPAEAEDYLARAVEIFKA